MLLVGMVEEKAHPTQEALSCQIVGDVAEGLLGRLQVERSQPNELTHAAREIECNRVLEWKARRPGAERRLRRP